MSVETFLEPLINRLKLIVGRCVIKATAYENGELLADLGLLAGESRRNVEFMQQFGFSSRPKGNVSGVALFVGGSRENGVVIATNGDDINQNLQPGEVCVHSPHGQKIILKSDGSVEISAASGKNIVCKNKITISGDINVVGSVNATGNVSADLNVIGTAKVKPVILSTHVHAGVTNGSSSTAIPT